jgi:ABC-2 type transport system permease protein/sodium transport system permease protein
MSQSATNRNTLAARVARLTRKELRETLRDRRTIVTLVIMPLLVYPVLSMAFQRFVLTTMPATGEKTYRLGLANHQDAQAFLALLSSADKIAGRVAGTTRKRQSQEEPRLPRIEIDSGRNPADAVASREVDLGVRIHRRDRNIFSGFPGAAIDCDLLFTSDSASSREALELVERRLASINESFLKLRLMEAGVQGPFEAVQSSRVPVEATVAPISFPLATLVPFILILTTITGAVYPAIDLTAGERERGTLEMLIAAPVPRMGLLVAKYVAVLSVAMLTAVVNCAAMAITVASIGLDKQLFGERGLTAELAIEFCGLLFLFAAFFSAVLLALTSFARSFKEAQAYLVPLMLVSTAPGIFTMIHGIRLTPILAVTPLANIVLLARDMFEYNASPLLSLLVLGSTLLYALAAIMTAAKLFGSDAVLYGSPGSWSETLHPAHKHRAAPTLGTSLLTLAAVTPIYILASNAIAQAGGSSMGVRLGLAGLATVLIFAVTPVVLLKWLGVSLRSGLSLRLPPILALAGAILLGISLWPFAHEIVVRQHERGWFTLHDEQMQTVAKMVRQWRDLPAIWILLCLAVAPAAGEEIFFRGLLLSGLRTRQDSRAAIMTSAVIFGVFHVVAIDHLLLKRFLPTTFLGIVLGWMTVRTGSILPGVILHAIHNGLLLLVAYYRDELAARGWGLEERSHIPSAWLFLAAIVAGIGIVLVLRASKHDSRVEVN